MITGNQNLTNVTSDVEANLDWTPSVWDMNSDKEDELWQWVH